MTVCPHVLYTALKRKKKKKRLQLSKHISLWSSFVTLSYRKYRRFENYFSEAVQERPDVVGFLIVSESSVGDFRRSVYFVKPCNSPDDNHVLVSIPQALGCMHLPFGMSSRQVPHVSIYRTFEASPFCSRVLWNENDKCRNDLPANPWKWTTHTWAFSCSFEVVVSVCMFFLSRRHAFRLLSSA